MPPWLLITQRWQSRRLGLMVYTAAVRWHSASMDDEPPDMPDLGKPIPAAWNELIAHLGGVEVVSRKRSELEARLQVWLLFTDLRARQLEAAAVARQARAMSIATWVLAAATLGLFIATIALVIRTP